MGDSGTLCDANRHQEHPQKRTDVIALLQGLFRKGNVLMEMGRQTEALVQFYHCLKLQTDFAPAKGQIKKVSSPDMHFPNTPRP